MSPTQRSLALMRERGFHVEICEHWNPFARRRVDLFGFLDLLCVGDNGELVGVQCTSLSNVSARIKKITESPLIGRIRKTNLRILVQGWKSKKVKGKRSEVKFREVDVS